MIFNEDHSSRLLSKESLLSFNTNFQMEPMFNPTFVSPSTMHCTAKDPLQDSAAKDPLHNSAITNSVHVSAMDKPVFVTKDPLMSVSRPFFHGRIHHLLSRN